MEQILQAIQYWINILAPYIFNALRIMILVVTIYFMVGRPLTLIWIKLTKKSIVGEVVGEVKIWEEFFSEPRVLGWIVLLICVVWIIFEFFLLWAPFYKPLVFIEAVFGLYLLKRAGWGTRKNKKIKDEVALAYRFLLVAYLVIVIICLHYNGVTWLNLLK